MTPLSERELGSIQEKLKNIEHRVRNDKTIINALLEEVDSVRLELNQFKHRVYGAGSAFILVAGLLAWVFELLQGK